MGLALAALLVVPAWSSAGASTELTYARLCRKALNVQGKTYALKRLGLVLQCADKLLKCELLAEIDGADPAACRESVGTSCAKRIGSQPESALGKLALRFDAKVGTACQTEFFDYVDFVSTGSGGLWFANDPACGTSIDLPSFMVCVRDQIDVRLDGLASALKPRTAVLFDNVGLGDAFPHLVRPPFVDVVLSATAPASGVLNDPGPLVVPAGSALRFTGDAASLGCGGTSTDGRVTVTIGTTATQRFTLQEPYAAGTVAIAGPWIAAGSVPFTIALDDGACQSNVSGMVTVP